MSILSDARQLLAETDQKIRDPTLTATETAWAAINFADKMSVMLPEVLAYAEMRERQAIEAQAKANYLAACPGENGWDLIVAKQEFREIAAKELSADLPPRITEGEKASIQTAIDRLKSSYEGTQSWRLVEQTVNVLRGLIS